MKPLNIYTTFMSLFIALNMFVIDASAQFVTLDSARLLSNGYYQLTPDIPDPIPNDGIQYGFKIGYVWNQMVHNLNNKLTVNARLNFGTKDGTGADGICFVMQDQCAGNSGVSGGGGMGYLGMRGKSIAVEFDTYQNIPGSGDKQYADPIYDHVAINTMGNPDHTTNLASPIFAPQPIINGSGTTINVEDGAWHDVQIDYDQSTTTLLVYFDGVEILRKNYDILTNIFNGNPYIYWGFCSSTGGSANFQQLDINANLNPPVLKDTTICPTTTPSVQVHLPPLEGYAGKNVALGRPAFASPNHQFPVKDALDGSFGTRWSSESGVDPQWIYVDLGSTYDVSSAVIYWETAAAATYNIETSTNGTSWSLGSSTFTRTPTVVSGTNTLKDVITFSAPNVRYVRMYGLTRTTGYGYSIYEFEVYGLPKYVWTASPAVPTSIDNINSADPTFTPTATTTYSVTIPDACLPSSTASFTVTVSCPAPLTFLSFDVKTLGDARSLSWTTTNEVTTSHFIIEKSDGNGVFYPIGKVNSANKPGVHAYGFTDPSFLAGTAYYRIVQYDLDSKFDYSVVRSVSAAADFVVLPNPSNGVFTLKGSTDSEEAYAITIISSIGQTVLSKTISPSTNPEILLDISEFASGTYILYITTSEKNIVKKIIKQ